MKDIKASNQAQSSDQSRQSNPLISVGTQNMVRCVKGVQIRSFFWSEYRRIQTRKNTIFGLFYAVVLNVSVNRLKYIKYANYEKTQTK